MALPNLAATADLSARGVTPTAVHTVMLAVASSIVRQAAGSPILETDSTVLLTAWGGRSLELPGRPVTAVATVEIDGTATTDFLLTDAGNLWRLAGWGCEDQPVTVEVTMTHGLVAVPPHIVQLVCDLAIAGANAATTGAHDANVIAEKVDDYAVTFASGAEAVAMAVELPALTRRWLKAQFGGGASVVTYR